MVRTLGFGNQGFDCFVTVPESECTKLRTVNITQTALGRNFDTLKREARASWGLLLMNFVGITAIYYSSRENVQQRRSESATISTEKTTSSAMNRLSRTGVAQTPVSSFKNSVPYSTNLSKSSTNLLWVHPIVKRGLGWAFEYQ